MLRNYFLVAYRNLTRNKFFSSINIIGLALGLTCSLLIMLWVLDEKSINQFHSNGNRLYTVYEKQYFDNQISGQRNVPGLLARELKKNYPDIEYSTAMTWNEQNTFRYGDKILQMPGTYADSDFFKMFSYPLLHGSAGTALSSPVSVAVSRKMAVALFGTPDAAMGKVLRVDDRKDFTVTAVFEDMPRNSSWQYDYILNWNDKLESSPWVRDWDNHGPAAHVMLRAGADPEHTEKEIRNIITSFTGEQAGFKAEVYLQKFSDQYLYSNFKNGVISGGKIEYVRLFSIVAAFILLIACINFMNLTTARSVKRAREIGIRKVVGAMRYSLIKQFLGEAILVTTIAMIVSILLLSLLLPVFNLLTEKQLLFPWQNLKFWTAIAVFTFCTGLLAGSYPALFLSSFKPILVLKGVLKIKGSANWFRKGLVVFQFALSSLLIIGTVVVSQQVDYIREKNLGYNRNNLVKIEITGELAQKTQLFREQALQIPGVSGITIAENDPLDLGNTTASISWEGKDPNTKPEFTHIGIGYDFVETMQLKMIAGRDFSPLFGTDSASFILNESAVNKIGYTNPVGRPFTYQGRPGKIIGVISDYHFRSMHIPIGPMVLHLKRNPAWGIAVARIEAGKTQAALHQLESLVRRLNPAFTFNYQFADAGFEQSYRTETLMQRLSGAFALLAVVISCLGLLGLAMFAAEQRVREIGIRKILGASLQSLFVILSREFLLLVFIAFVIACPIAWWAMNNWLQDFEYRVQMNAWPFALAGTAAIAIALVTISFQTLRAALANPVKSLKSE
ncbi:FtsX-like permease family protein [Pseudoflavitalea sp. G-6-1-2]|uniref:ABC transporter permease n=1 Tax=Pseudoflavitalea sp. G-6-1-2 TaxID=2728841 RepID=UPI00146C1FEC|nr:ABC transporter permease [Pseudoflavitalea sp. G-6-1-2]NML23662.1 FtsX-like permease family protein [Pseudoflavitalea sp. G-6-1-2]